MTASTAPAIVHRAAAELPLRGLSAYVLYLLAHCERRLYLWRHAPDEAAPPDDFDRLLMERGQAHERAVRERHPGAVGPLWRWGQPLAPAAAETRRRLLETRASLYQGVLLSGDGERVGVPDFLHWDAGTLVVQEVKLALRAAEHPEIVLQLAHYAALAEELLPGIPVRTEFVNGDGETVVVARDRAVYAAALSRARALLDAAEEPDLLLAHSTCADCPFYGHCWDRAEAEGRVEILSEVFGRRRQRLRELGLETIAALAAADPETVRGPGVQSAAHAMVAEARAHRDRAPVLVGPNPLTTERPLVWIDFEGDPEPEGVGCPIYLWGLALQDGPDRPRYEPFLAERGEADDAGAWTAFLARATEILDCWPHARFVHYASYEKTWIANYAARHLDSAAAAGRVRDRLFDLYHHGVRRAVRLPLRSYSIKFIAPVAGFAWRNPDSGSAWSIVQYRRALATPDAGERRRLLDAIVEYNEDDVLAMRAVWLWLEGFYRPGADRGQA